MCLKFFLFFSLALNETRAVLKISFATVPHTQGPHTGSDIFKFAVFFRTFYNYWTSPCVSRVQDSSVVYQKSVSPNQVERMPNILLLLLPQQKRLENKLGLSSDKLRLNLSTEAKLNTTVEFQILASLEKT